MSKIIDISVEKDHIESLTKANGINALSELLWNSLDADATEIYVKYKPTEINGYDYLKIMDNGHGLTYEKAQDVFSRIGGSEKKNKTQSPEGRAYHGKEGKGRYKGLALGDMVRFTSTFFSNEIYYEFTITIDRNQLSRTEISDLRQKPKGENKTGFIVEIFNFN